MCHASYLQLAKISVYFYFIFHIEIFFLDNFLYIANAFYFIIGESSYSIFLISRRTKCCFVIAEIENRPGVFTSTLPEENPLSDQTRCTFTHSRANLNGSIINTCIVFLLKPIRDNLVPGFPRAVPSLAVMHSRTLGPRFMAGVKRSLFETIRL